MNKLIFSLDNNSLANTIAKKLQIEIGKAEIRDFPDGDSYVRIDSDVKDKSIILINSLDHPNNKLLALFFLSQKLKELGAKEICLVTPYLPYMRQDKEFNKGEAVTAIYFAKLLSTFIDKLITVDPHLHRIKKLSEIYTIPTSTLHAIEPVAKWIKENISSPFIIGPDEESRQWVAEIAKSTNAEYVIIKKTRQGDRKVTITLPEIKDTQVNLVLVDDIISTGTTLIAVIQQLLAQGFKSPVCIGIHALFNDEIYKTLLKNGAKEIVTTNSIAHPTNKIDLSNLLAEAIRQC